MRTVVVNKYNPDYDPIANKPSINDVELTGNKTSAELGLQPAGDYLTEEVDPTVPAWAKEPTKPDYNYSEISETPTIPTKVSELENDSGFMTTYTEIDPTIPDWARADTKPDYNYDELNFLPQINSVELSGNKSLFELGVQPAGSYLTEETDPTVPAWAKAETKPSYSYNELTDSPQINSVTLSGNQTSADLGLQPAGSYLTEETDPTVPAWAKGETKPAYDITELTDINITSVADKQLLQYNSTISKWENVSAGEPNKIYTLVILTTDWSANQFSQQITGLTGSDIVLIQAADNYYNDYGLSYTQLVDTITFTVTTTPDINLAVGIAVTKAVDGGIL